jgi:hypothetical protein
MRDGATALALVSMADTAFCAARRLQTPVLGGWALLSRRLVVVVVKGPTGGEADFSDGSELE